MSKAIVFLTDGFEEIETITTADILRRAEITVVTMSLTDNREVTGSHDIKIIADELFDDNTGADILILPGGHVVKSYLEHTAFIGMLRRQNERNLYIAAICAAPTALGKMGLLDDKTATCYPTLTGELIAKNRKSDAVVADGNIITGRSPGVSAQFALTLVEILAGKGTAERVKVNMYM